MISKVVLISAKDVDTKQIVHSLLWLNDSINQCPVFTTDVSLKDRVSDAFEYYMDLSDIQQAYKNNALLFVSSTEDVSYGVTMNDLYSNDIVVLSFEDFNNILNDTVLNELLTDSIIVFVDTNTKHSNEELCESSFVFDKLNNIENKYLYFVNESTDTIAKTIDLLIKAKETENTELIEKVYNMYE